MNEKIELIKEYIEKNASKVIADYITAPFGERLGFYISGEVVSHAVGQSIGNEIAEYERAIVVMKCPGVGNEDSHFWLAGWTHENEDYEIVVDETGEIIDFSEAIRRCCEEGDISSCVEGMIQDIERMIEEDEREKEGGRR